MKRLSRTLRAIFRNPFKRRAIPDPHAVFLGSDAMVCLPPDFVKE